MDCDYESLEDSYESLEDAYERLHDRNDQLTKDIFRLKTIILDMERKGKGEEGDDEVYL